ncbi:uncharacterized protein BO66DRAFT_243328 [Aspergillus aculeatinus CBS 121060]|uniref:Uncharacterized protein n=1 Tax=Aspergillus aculeatinus CBS 121060 TaxID=1448322 RepID=A0ACD1GSP3_9EURO|nr:hypothetical protein BO66DRAFT_243328 [Aspergillus aculeatinus CBS 121060]RAH64337.1 hypothetical protein BO66DRAFT_243328 [Aspergillus aculeatinus CBS 121060]
MARQCRSTGFSKMKMVYVIATQREVAKLTSRQGSETDSWVCHSRATNFSSTAMLNAKPNWSLCLMSFLLQLPVSLSYIWPAFDKSFRKERPVSHCSSQSAAYRVSVDTHLFRGNNHRRSNTGPNTSSVIQLSS